MKQIAKHLMGQLSGQSSTDLPRRWWQWVLMYPTMAVALLGAAPQFYEWFAAASLGLPLFGNVKDAKLQEQAWERNVHCISAIEHIKPTSKTDYAIDLVTCPSGDILITLTPLQNPDRSVSRWIVTTDLFSKSASLGFLTSAYAQESPDHKDDRSPTRVIAIKKSGPNVTRRVQLPDNSCSDQSIDAYTGRQLGQRKAPCSPF
jgi:hypothetical protein